MIAIPPPIAAPLDSSSLTFSLVQAYHRSAQLRIPSSDWLTAGQMAMWASVEGCQALDSAGNLSRQQPTWLRGIPLKVKCRVREGVKELVVAAVCDRRLLFISTAWSALIERRYVRLKACLIGEVEVLFRYTLSGL